MNSAWVEREWTSPQGEVWIEFREGHFRPASGATTRTDAPIIAGRSFNYYLEPPHMVWHECEPEPMRDPVREAVAPRVERFRRGDGPL